MAIDLTPSKAPPKSQEPHHETPISPAVASATGRKGVPEKKATGAFVSLAAEDRARWTGRSHAAVSREGFVKNPVAHRSVRLIAQVAASVAWLLCEGDPERRDHAVLSLLGQPNGRMGGPDFFETLDGHLLFVSQRLYRAVAGRQRPARTASAAAGSRRHRMRLGSAAFLRRWGIEAGCTLRADREHRTSIKL
jgi:hypothetical protein